MKTPPVSLLLGVCLLLLSGLRVSAVSLSLSPNLQQFFFRDSVSLSCVGDGQTADGQTVKRTTGGQTDPCGSGFGTFDGSSCTVPVLSPSDSGVYWCETSSGQSSLQVNISVTSSARLILEIPALPVLTGSDVTLRCRNKDKKRVKAFFFRGGVHLGSGPDGGFTISRVQQSDEGLYSCSTDKLGLSPHSWLRVRDPPPPPPSLPPLPPPSPPPPPPPHPHPPPSSPSTSSLPVPVIAALVPVVVLVLLVLGVLVLWRRKHKGTEEVTYGQVVIRGQRSAGRSTAQPSDPEVVYSSVRAGTEEVTYGQVVIKGQRSAGRSTAQPSDPEVVYSSVRAGK
ncbi:fibroblast growth factor receptor-like 1 isoform X5 [Trachinotus anak]|uniref:fibroblast growth factor receptor-like 1 isoform X5 n=1 Tax=Trachinotus anak TaxID=443729 RepID=UPI0039F179E7